MPKKKLQEEETTKEEPAPPPAPQPKKSAFNDDLLKQLREGFDRSEKLKSPTPPGEGNAGGETNA